MFDWFKDDDDDPDRDATDDWTVDVSTNVDHLMDVDVSVSVDHAYTQKADGPTGTLDPEPTVGPATPKDTPDPTPKTRGRFQFPSQKSFMQALEIRAKNGAQTRVETVYVITGNTYTTPTDIFALDDPEFYSEATPTSVRSNGKAMAERIAQHYPAGEAPRLIARIHTHPRGKVIPSSADQDSASRVKEHFEEVFNTTDFEFFHGIHAYQHSNTHSENRHTPEQTGNNVTWYGEQYVHELGLFDETFQTPKEVLVP